MIVMLSGTTGDDVLSAAIEAVAIGVREGMIDYPSER
jgi:hypothetical protein